MALSPGRDRSVLRSMISFVARKMRQRRLPVTVRLPACPSDFCVSINTCVCVCVCMCVRVEIRTRNRTTRKQRKIHTHRTGAAKTRRRRGRRVTGFGGWSHDFHLRRRRWPTSSAYFWTCLSCLPKSNGSR